MKISSACALLLLAVLSTPLLAQTPGSLAACPAVGAPAAPAEIPPALLPPILEPTWDWAYCVDCDNELFSCLGACGGEGNPCADECYSFFRQCRRGCIE